MQREKFQLLYRRRKDGLYETRTDLVLRFFTLAYPVLVETYDGAELAHVGDWIVQGAGGALWPIPEIEASACFSLEHSGRRGSSANGDQGNAR